ncbi:DUF6296 family protein [Streptomyces sp. NPDC057674]|uniref:DUF6296 family protein n=1 Tax=Streptomyces sp. NPDC057674 TaxID=3346203 RepID=UPI00368BB14E
MSISAEGQAGSDRSPEASPLVRYRSGTVGDGGLTSSQPPHPAKPKEARQRYELAFPGESAAGQDLVEVKCTARTGPGGHAVYEDVTGIVQAEISLQAEVRILATGGGQDAVRGVEARPLP